MLRIIITNKKESKEEGQENKDIQKNEGILTNKKREKSKIGKTITLPSARKLTVNRRTTNVQEEKLNVSTNEEKNEKKLNHCKSGNLDIKKLKLNLQAVEGNQLEDRVSAV